VARAIVPCLDRDSFHLAAAARMDVPMLEDRESGRAKWNEGRLVAGVEPGP